jgi:hypothetical protein
VIEKATTPAWSAVDRLLLMNHHEGNIVCPRDEDSEGQIVPQP